MSETNDPNHELIPCEQVTQNRYHKEIPDCLLDQVVSDRTLREWQTKYPYLKQYPLERQLRKIPKLSASEFFTEFGLRMLQRACGTEDNS